MMFSQAFGLLFLIFVLLQTRVIESKTVIKNVRIKAQNSYDNFDDTLDDIVHDIVTRGSRCRIRPKCLSLGGFCVKKNKNCPGRIWKKMCKGRKCKCCIPDTRTTTSTTDRITTAVYPLLTTMRQSTFDIITTPVFPTAIQKHVTTFNIETRNSRSTQNGLTTEGQSVSQRKDTTLDQNNGGSVVDMTTTQKGQTITEGEMTGFRSLSTANRDSTTTITMPGNTTPEELATQPSISVTSASNRKTSESWKASATNLGSTAEGGANSLETVKETQWSTTPEELPTSFPIWTTT